MSSIDPGKTIVVASGNTVWSEQQISDWLAPLFVNAPTVRAAPKAKRKVAVQEPTPEQAARAEREAWNREVERRKAEKLQEKIDRRWVVARTHKEPANGT